MMDDVVETSIQYNYPSERLYVNKQAPKTCIPLINHPQHLYILLITPDQVNNLKGILLISKSKI